MPGLIEILEALEIGVEMDWDGEVTLRPPPGVHVERLVERFGADLVRCMEARRRAATRIFVGGPLDGKPYGLAFGYRSRYAHHCGRARWAVYEVEGRAGRLGRAWFRGWARSKAKARRGEWSR